MAETAGIETAPPVQESETSPQVEPVVEKKEGETQTESQTTEAAALKTETTKNEGAGAEDGHPTPAAESSKKLNSKKGRFKNLYERIRDKLRRAKKTVGPNENASAPATEATEAEANKPEGTETKEEAKEVAPTTETKKETEPVVKTTTNENTGAESSEPPKDATPEKTE